MSKINRKYGWRPDLPSMRKVHFNITAERRFAALAPKIDLRAGMPPVWDQGNLGSCTAHACGAAVEYLQKIEKPAWLFMPSRLFIYYNERVIEGTVASDAGATITDSVAAIQKYGVPPESYWGYDVTKFADTPPVAAFKDAVKHEALTTQTINQDIQSMKAVIAGGLPFIFGFTVYDSFESDAVAQSGIVPLPASTENQLGGHAVCASGYDDTFANADGSVGSILVRNSWGTGWGYQGSGYFWMPYSYITNSNLAQDFHVLQKLTN